MPNLQFCRTHKHFKPYLLYLNHRFWDSYLAETTIDISHTYRPSKHTNSPAGAGLH
jgi:hypothetical protein